MNLCINQISRPISMHLRLYHKRTDQNMITICMHDLQFTIFEALILQHLLDGNHLPRVDHCCLKMLHRYIEYESPYIIERVWR